MRRLILALLLLATKGFALVDGTVDFYPFTANANGTNYNFTNNGTVTFQTISSQLCAGTFSTTKYFSAPAAFNTAIAGLNTWTIEIQFYQTSVARNLIIGFANSLQDTIFAESDGSLKAVFNGGTVSLSATSVLGANTWYDLVITGNGQQVVCYINGTVRNTISSPYTIPSTVNLVVGRRLFDGLAPLAGYVYNFRFMNKYTTTGYPISDPAKIVTGAGSVNGSGAVSGGGSVTGAGSSN